MLEVGEDALEKAGACRNIERGEASLQLWPVRPLRLYGALKNPKQNNKRTHKTFIWTPTQQLCGLVGLRPGMSRIGTPSRGFCTASKWPCHGLGDGMGPQGSVLPFPEVLLWIGWR